MALTDYIGDIKRCMEHKDSALKTLEEAVRAYSRSQKELWQKIPYLAIMAYGKPSEFKWGYEDMRETAFNYGLWPMRSSYDTGSFKTAIDCATGEIIESYYLENQEVADSLQRYMRSKDGKAGINYPKKHLAERDDVLLLSRNLERLDAAGAIAELEATAKREDESHQLGPYHIPAQRLELLDRLRKNDRGYIIPGL